MVWDKYFFVQKGKALSNLEFPHPTRQVTYFSSFYLSGKLAFNDFVKTHYFIFSIVYFYCHGFLKVKTKQKQTWENIWDRSV